MSTYLVITGDATGGTVTDIIVADPTFAAAYVAASGCAFCNLLTPGSGVDIGWTYTASSNTYTPPPTH